MTGEGATDAIRISTEAPELLDYLDDWFEARLLPHTFDPLRKGARWREAMTLLTRHHLALQLMTSRCPWAGGST